MSKLFVVGTGPGDLQLLAPKAAEAITASSDLVAYGLYLDLLGKICEGKTHHDLPLDVEIEVIPGISAMQAGAAAVGAMLGHDFCTVSLSNLLTPWETIEKRIHSAGQGDFVVSFYNPVIRSTRRQRRRYVYLSVGG